jgi:uncharacterized coiled-coil protein SlyX
MKHRNTIFATILLVFACFGLFPRLQAVSPPPDGGYAGATTAEGQNALQSLTSGVWNTALGYQALFHDTTGNQNTATGYQALFTNTMGDQNAADGVLALSSNTTGSFNTASGFGALSRNTIGGSNTAVGYDALYGNTIGDYNTAIGWKALNNTAGEGQWNTACGAIALAGNTGSYNTASGYAALYSNMTGSDNTAYGTSALANNPNGSNNIALGEMAGYEIFTGDNNIDIGNPGENGDSDTIRIGLKQNAVYIAGINTAVTGVAVLLGNTGQLGVATSSARFKDEIKPMDKTSEAILALKPVTFRYKKEIDAERTTQFGLVAEEVEKVNPDLVARDKEGKPFTVRYDAVNAMLLNEFLKEHRKVEHQERKLAQQETIIAQLKSAVTRQEATAAEQRKEIEALTAGLQNVTDQLALSKLAPRMVLNHQ